MTLLVRDEADIVRANIEYHLDHGVDFIIATDNGSVDGTYQILEQYQKKGVLHLIREEEQNFAQCEWVNRMGRIACNQYHADLIFHCDADEFWWASSGSLKNELSHRHKVDVLDVNVNNMIFVRTGEMDSFSKSLYYAVTKPLQSTNHGVDSLDRSLFLFKSAGKVIYRTRNGYLEVGQGNHGIVDPHVSISQKKSLDIQIIHYPLRSYGQFERKVLNGGLAYEKNPSKAGGWQWRRWYESYKRGELYNDYCTLTLDDRESHKYLNAGVLSDWLPRHRKICSYL